jgi:tripartite-type tricarboxylate transporter receptor subunit TctC
MPHLARRRSARGMTRRSLLQFICALCLGFGAIPHAAAQAYPSKPVRLIVPFPAGGGSDVIGRILAQKLTEGLGQQVFIENRAGAGGSIGTEAAVRAPADGYTLVLASTSEIAVNPAVYSRLSYDTLKDLAPVAMVASTPMVVIVSPSLPVTSIGELIKLAKQKPGQLNVASAGNGSFTHLASELFRSMTELTWTHVPYKGAPPAITDLASGRAQVMFSTMPAAMGAIKGNLVRPIAVSSTSRAATLPDVPTVSESGVAGYEPEYWYGVFVPAATPRDVVAKLANAIAQSITSSEVIHNFANQGAAPARLSPEEFRAYVKAEVARWGKVVNDAGAKLD